MLDQSERDYEEIWDNLNQPDPFKWVNDEIYARVWLGSIRTGSDQITDEFGRIFLLDKFFEYFPVFQQGEPRWRDNFPKSIVLTEKLRFKSVGSHTAGQYDGLFNHYLDISGYKSGMNFDLEILGNIHFLRIIIYDFHDEVLIRLSLLL